MSKSILSNPSPRANLSHHGHDLSQSNIFSSTVGEIVPVYRHLMNPNEKISLSFQLSTRTEPLKTPGMINIEECIDVFAVPISQIYEPFKQQFYGINDFKSNWYSDPKSSTTPDLSANELPSASLGAISSAVQLAEGSNLHVSPARFMAGSDVYTVRTKDSARLACFMGLPYSILGGDASTTMDTRQVSLFWFAAYQKIFYDYFRLTDWTQNNPSAFNLDRFYYGENRSWLTSPVNLVENLLRLRFVPYRKDYFTNIFTSPYIGSPGSSGSASDVSMLEGVNFAPRYLNMRENTVGSGVQFSQGADLVMSDPYSGVNQRVPEMDGGSTESGINVLNLRAAFALQKVAETTRRSAKRFDAQTLAHFGARVNEGMDGRVIHIGHFSQSIVSKDVVSTSASETSDGVEPLGSLAGKGYSQSQSKTFTFSTENNYGHCIIMAVYYARPVVDYYQTGLDKLDMLTTLDAFYRPEYDKLGMQPIYASEAFYDPATPVNNNRVVGYQYRYSEFKMKKDVVHGALAGIRRDWTIARIPYLTGTAATQESFMYVSPCDVDQIFENYYNSTWSADASGSSSRYEQLFASDPLSHQLFVNAKLSSTMSVYGLEDL